MTIPRILAYGAIVLACATALELILYASQHASQHEYCSSYLTVAGDIACQCGDPRAPQLAPAGRALVLVLVLLSGSPLLMLGRWMKQ